MPPSQSPLAAGAVPTSSPSSSQSTPLPSTTHLATFEPSIPHSQVSTPDASEKPTSSDLVPTADASDMPKLKKSISIQDQSTRLPLRRILVIYVGIGIALMVSFIDQTSVSTASPVIGTALDGSDSISWVGTAFFVAKWVFASSNRHAAVAPHHIHITHPCTSMAGRGTGLTC
jgi:hypothetical protein